jgi:tripartite-type tricarboxylate transporter receptor subunit TctC
MEHTRRKFIATAVAGAAATQWSVAALAQQAYPARDISGVIGWGAGGGTDVAMRGYAPYAEEVLGRKIVLQNKAGGSGAIAANFVLQQPADGYTLLMTAEPQALFRVMGIADFDYDKFYPINIASVGNSVLLVVHPDAPWKTAQELVAHVQANPNKLKMSMAGQGSAPFTINAMINTLTKFDTIKVPFDGDGPALAAVQGKHIDFGFISSGSTWEHVKAGRLRALAVVDPKPFQGVPSIADVPALKGITKYLPWGSWYGVFVRRETPDDAKAKLVAAFKKAGENPQYRALLEGRGNTMLNISGAEAEAFIRRFQSTTAWLYHAAGAAKKDPAELGIPKP